MLSATCTGQASEDEGSEGELSEGELSVDPRTELEQRWQSQGRQAGTDTPFRTRYFTRAS